MQELYTKLQDFDLDYAIKLEETDRQFIALKELVNKQSEKKVALALVVANSIICYQLSGTWENYWEEFSLYFSSKKISYENIVSQLSEFIKQSKNNKRFIDTKIKRLEKVKVALELLKNKEEYFYNNMTELRDLLAKTMKQKITDKTIVFAVKMFGYVGRNIFSFVAYPKEIFIPIDSRLTNLFEKYKWEYSDINKFYLDLSEKLDIPLLHLDWIVWINYDELMK